MTQFCLSIRPLIGNLNISYFIFILDTEEWRHNNVTANLFGYCHWIWLFPVNSQEYVPHPYTLGNAVYKQILAEGVKQSVPKYHSDPPAGYWVIWEKRCNTGSEIHSSKQTDNVPLSSAPSINHLIAYLSSTWIIQASERSYFLYTVYISCFPCRRHSKVMSSPVWFLSWLVWFRLNIHK